MAIEKLKMLFQPAIDIPISDQVISSHLTTGISNNEFVTLDISESEFNWLLHPEGPDNHLCSTPTWYNPIKLVLIADNAINNNIQFCFIATCPIKPIAITTTCGQRCKMHKLHGGSPTINSNQNAPTRRPKETKAGNNNACL